MSGKKIVILFPCIGRRVSLLRSFRQACRRLDREAVIVGTDTTENSSALQCCDRKYIVRPVHHRGYGREVTEIIRKEKVDLLVPTVDLDLPVWARRRGQLAQMGCTALISSPRVVRICQDKRKTFTFLKEYGFETPDTTIAALALKRKRHHFPYFLKPWDGYASRGNVIVRNLKELKFYAKRIPNCLVQDFIDGQEHTIDVLVDFDGAVRCIVPRLRIETRGGEVSKGTTVKHKEIIEQSKRLIETLGAGPGVITIQCFLAKHKKTGRAATETEQIKFIEVNPRFGGGVPLSIKAGANFPLWILRLSLGQKPRIRQTGWRDGFTMLRYDEAVWFEK